MTLSTHREVERKLRVHALFDLPDLAGLADVVHTHEPVVLRAVYHDTAALTLFRWGVTLRRREGGTDSGWHLKLPVAGADGSARDELRLPLDAGGVGAVPGALVEIVAPLLRDQPLRPVVELSTERTARVLADSAGHDLVEVVDDVVTVLRDGRAVSVFRELEVEAIDAGDPAALALLDVVVAHLRSAGGVPSSASKAAAALGPQASAPPDVPALALPPADGLAVDALRAILSTHVRHLLFADIGVRRDLPDAVHQMRVAARRLRSTLRTFGPLLDRDLTDPLAVELKWMATELGAIRDTEVMQSRLDEHAVQLADPADTERARAAIDAALGQRMHAARSSALAALRSDRHSQLLADLVAVALDPPVTDAAYATCQDALPALVARPWHRLVRSVRGLDLGGPSVDWHAARITAKRARYAAEATSEVFGKSMRSLARSLAVVTELLGDHQDAHVAQILLREIAASAHADGATGLALGRLHEFEVAEEQRDRRRFVAYWPTAVRHARRAGLRP